MIDPNVDMWFTDGLGIHDCFGAGIYGPCITTGKAYLWAAFHRVFGKSDSSPEVCRTPSDREFY
jgi:hypothetical protein